MAGFPDRAKILERLKVVVAERVNVDPNQLVPDARLSDIGIDSFALIELVFVAEEEFKIKIPVDDLQVTTVNDILGVIEHFGSASAI